MDSAFYFISSVYQSIRPVIRVLWKIALVPFLCFSLYIVGLLLMEETTIMVAQPIAEIIKEDLNAESKVGISDVVVYQPTTIPSRSVLFNVLEKRRDFLVEASVRYLDDICLNFLANATYEDDQWKIDNLRVRPGPITGRCD